ncbi:MAG TPA: hypothetical protein VGZ22_12635 [Isosphaeraceae bacterium]|jgi:hypothetical protein|nr:hypothetical protein [Isosphaeraceae bacterium]
MVQAEAQGQPWPPQPVAEPEVSPGAERYSEVDLNAVRGAEIPDQPSYEPEPEMPEPSAEL